LVGKAKKKAYTQNSIFSSPCTTYSFAPKEIFWLRRRVRRRGGRRKRIIMRTATRR
jgi:hypothetical protein